MGAFQYMANDSQISGLNVRQSVQILSTKYGYTFFPSMINSFERKSIWSRYDTCLSSINLDVTSILISRSDEQDIYAIQSSPQYYHLSDRTSILVLHVYNMISHGVRHKPDQ